MGDKRSDFNVGNFILSRLTRIRLDIRKLIYSKETASCRERSQ
jgi:hypothetical protein